MEHAFTAIILSYKRPWNVQILCNTVLSVSSVVKLILSNNNPDIDLKPFLDINDKRLQIINQATHTSCFIRFEIAKVEKSKYFFCIDDDLFLDKVQIKYLMSKLLNETTTVHGFWGQTIYTNDQDVTFKTEINKDKQVDILNRAYFFTMHHIIEMFRLIDLCSLEIKDIGPCDDIFLSFSGMTKPIIHYISHFKDCLTSNSPGIAVWKEENFEYKRKIIYKKLSKAKLLN